MAPKRKAARIHKGSSALDVRDPSQLPALYDMLGKHEINLILIYADYCGHCHRYKDEVWNGLASLPNRRAGLGSIHYDQLENTPFANAKIDGYPSVILVGKDKVPAEFQSTETGAPTNALPDARNQEVLKTILTEEPQTVIKNVPNMIKAPNVTTEETTTLEPTNDRNFPEDVETLRSKRNTELLSGVTTNELFTTTSTASAPPNVAEDVLNSQKPSVKESDTEFTYTPAKTDELPKAGKGVLLGGSLYSSLLAATREAGPAIALTAAAAAIAKKGRGRGRRRTARAQRGRRTTRGGRRTTRKN